MDTGLPDKLTSLTTNIWNIKSITGENTRNNNRLKTN